MLDVGLKFMSAMPIIISITFIFLAKFMGDDKPPPYQYPPNYALPPPQQNVAPQPATGGAGTGAKTFFPIYDSYRFFRV